MAIYSLTRTGLLVVVLSVSHAAYSSGYDPETLTVPAASLLSADLLQGQHYKIANDVLVSGYMNHYSVDSDFGQFTAVGNRSLKKLLHEIGAIAQLKKMTSASVGVDAAADAVASTGKSLAALVNDPEGSMQNLGAGVSRLFKRTAKTAKDVSAEAKEAASGDDANKDAGAEADQPSTTSKLASSYLGIGKAHRKIASELKVDPYSDNAVLQAELARVAQVSGTVGKVTNILIPIPSVVGTAASVSNMVWNLSPTDLLIQNQETLKALGYSDELSGQFFANKAYSPTEQTAFVAAVKSLAGVKGSEALIRIAVRVETKVEGDFVVRSVLFTQLYHEQVTPIKAILTSPNLLVPVVVTKAGGGLIIAPLDQLLFTKQAEAAIDELDAITDQHVGSGEHLLWVEGTVSDLALSNLKSRGWAETSSDFDKLEKIIKD